MNPLPQRIRPNNLDEFIGQNHLTGDGKPIRRAIEKQEPFSFIFEGPPGSGKTTLAYIYTSALGGNFHELSAVAAKKSDVRSVIEEAQNSSKETVLFLDEIHRFNKAQQDYLLPYVEDGTIILIGATTENASFEVIAPLQSRCQIFEFKRLTDSQIDKIINRTGIEVENTARAWLKDYSNGDARRVLNLIEAVNKLYDEVTVETLEAAASSKKLNYDKGDEEHYNTISAYIKSMRAGDSEAALYYLARMIEGGEDPKFIARRMVIFASEDIGVAQPTAVVVANNAFRAVENVGLPECEINLAHATTYLSRADKDRSAYKAYRRAQNDVKEKGNLPIPLSIRNAPTELMQERGYGEGYKMYPDDNEDLRPDEVADNNYFDDQNHE